MKSYSKLCKEAAKDKWEKMFALHVRAFKLPHPQIQFRFYPGRKFQSDFAWPNLKILVELEGGIWRRNEHGNFAGAHSFPGNILRDIEKQSLAASLGYLVFRFTGDDIKSLKAIKMIQEAIRKQEGRQNDIDLL